MQRTFQRRAAIILAAAGMLGACVREDAAALASKQATLPTMAIAILGSPFANPPAWLTAAGRSNYDSQYSLDAIRNQVIDLATKVSAVIDEHSTRGSSKERLTQVAASCRVLNGIKNDVTKHLKAGSIDLKTVYMPIPDGQEFIDPYRSQWLWVHIDCLPETYHAVVSASLWDTYDLSRSYYARFRNFLVFATFTEPGKPRTIVIPLIGERTPATQETPGGISYVLERGEDGETLRLLDLVPLSADRAEGVRRNNVSIDAAIDSALDSINAGTPSYFRYRELVREIEDDRYIRLVVHRYFVRDGSPMQDYSMAYCVDSAERANPEEVSPSYAHMPCSTFFANLRADQELASDVFDRVAAGEFPLANDAKEDYHQPVEMRDKIDDFLAERLHLNQYPTMQGVDPARIYSTLAYLDSLDISQGCVLPRSIDYGEAGEDFVLESKYEKYRLLLSQLVIFANRANLLGHSYIKDMIDYHTNMVKTHCLPH